jgi:hypothetical protein
MPMATSTAKIVRAIPMISSVAMVLFLTDHLT